MRSLLYTFASTSSFRLEVTSDDARPDELLDKALQNLKEPGSPNVDGVLTVMQRYIKDCGISIKTHFVPHQNDRLKFPRSFGVRPLCPTGRSNHPMELGNIAQGHRVTTKTVFEPNSELMNGNLGSSSSSGSSSSTEHNMTIYTRVR